MKNIMLSLLALACVGQAHAYQAEVGGEINTSDLVDSLVLGGEFYIHGVNATSGPFAEASFLEKSTYVQGFFEDRDFGGSYLFGGGRYVDKNSGLFLDGGLQFGDLDGFRVGAGMYLNSSTTILGFLNSNDFIDIFGATAKHLMFQNDGTYINLEAGLEFGDGDGNYESTEFSFEGDYYLDKTLSVGAGISFISVERSFTADDSGFVLTADAKKFLQDNISINGGVTFANLDSDSDLGLNVGADMRF